LSLKVGELIRLRGREWVVESVREGGDAVIPKSISIACIDDDAQGERFQAVIDAEIDVRRVEDEVWNQIGQSGTDDPEVFAAHLRAVTWRSATAADRGLFRTRAGTAPASAMGAGRAESGACGDHFGNVAAGSRVAPPLQSGCGLAFTACAAGGAGEPRTCPNPLQI
jgi:hypothetical protein